MPAAIGKATCSPKNKSAIKVAMMGELAMNGVVLATPNFKKLVLTIRADMPGAMIPEAA